MPLAGITAVLRPLWIFFLVLQIFKFLSIIFFAYLFEVLIVKLLFTFLFSGLHFPIFFLFLKILYGFYRCFYIFLALWWYVKFRTKLVWDISCWFLLILHLFLYYIYSIRFSKCSSFIKFVCGFLLSAKLMSRLYWYYESGWSKYKQRYDRLWSDRRGIFGFFRWPDMVRS